jgi:hypothetical protein
LLVTLTVPEMVASPDATTKKATCRRQRRDSDLDRAVEAVGRAGGYLDAPERTALLISEGVTAATARDPPNCWQALRAWPGWQCARLSGGRVRWPGWWLTSPSLRVGEFMTVR